MRVAVLWTGLSGYLNACLRELASRPGVELFVAHSESNSQAPYDKNQFKWMKHEVVWRGVEDFAMLQFKLHAFDPQVVVVAGWHVPIYRLIMKSLKGRCLRIMAMDNRWSGTAKQWLGSFIASIHVLPYADAAWVPGHHQANFARKLGFPLRDILHGSLSCEQPAFSTVYEERIHRGEPLPKAFIFVGRLMEAKGLDILSEGYGIYQESVTDPWPLVVCGTGPLSSILEGKPGIQLKGFVQPEDLPKQLAAAGCLILPSTFEPWALVVNEATAAGLIIVSTETVGAVPHLVQNYHNGFVVEAGDAAALAETMSQITVMDADRRERMSRASHELSQQYTPARWANALLDFANDRKLCEE
jgi:glycosyltransferase involved in cell wall biosynthesis